MQLASGVGLLLGAAMTQFQVYLRGLEGYPTIVSRSKTIVSRSNEPEWFRDLVEIWFPTYDSSSRSEDSGPLFWSRTQVLYYDVGRADVQEALSRELTWMIPAGLPCVVVVNRPSGEKSCFRVLRPTWDSDPLSVREVEDERELGALGFFSMSRYIPPEPVLNPFSGEVHEREAGPGRWFPPRASSKRRRS